MPNAQQSTSQAQTLPRKSKWCAVCAPGCGCGKTEPGAGWYKKVCPACEQTFYKRDAKVVCCSRLCARRHQAKTALIPGNWKGGRWKVKTGYWKVKAKGHPRGDSGGYVFEHILVMEKTLGRHLHEFERVHHKNAQRDDNRPENLELWGSNCGRVKKDPSGARMSDLLACFLEQPEVTDKAAIEAAFRRIFKL